jgi:6,7-dimethyl-8-ribityllumazine synthase
MLKKSFNSIKRVSDKNTKIYIVVSRFNEKITKGLQWGAELALKEMKIPVKNYKIIFVPGAFEIPVAVKKIIENKVCDGILTLGCVIKGETAHFEYISGSVSYSLNSLSHQYGVPIGFGVLTCYNEKQALKRSGKNKFNKGYESALSLFNVIDTLKNI